MNEEQRIQRQQRIWQILKCALARHTKYDCMHTATLLWAPHSFPPIPFICQSWIIKLIVHALIFWSIFQICYCLLSFLFYCCCIVLLLLQSYCTYILCCCSDSFWLPLLKLPDIYIHTHTYAQQLLKEENEKYWLLVFFSPFLWFFFFLLLLHVNYNFYI